jgi:hypothetical protein
MDKFRSTSLAQKWAKLHKDRQKLIEGKQTVKKEDEIDCLSSFMSACKIGFLLNEAKIKKIIKVLRELTGKRRIKYGAIPEGLKTNTTLYKDIVVLYAEKGEYIFFREHDEK